VCRKCYVHPALLEGYLEGRLRAGRGRRADESAVLALLRRRKPVSLAPLLRRSISRVQASGRPYSQVMQ
jgi:DNA topoisomerase IB